MPQEPTYGQIRRAVYQMFTAESVYLALGKVHEAEECRRIAVEIMARMSEPDFIELRRELLRDSPAALPGHRKGRKSVTTS